MDPRVVQGARRLSQQLRQGCLREPARGFELRTRIQAAVQDKGGNSVLERQLPLAVFRPLRADLVKAPSTPQFQQDGDIQIGVMGTRPQRRGRRFRGEHHRFPLAGSLEGPLEVLGELFGDLAKTCHYLVRWLVVRLPTDTLHDLAVEILTIPLPNVGLLEKHTRAPSLALWVIYHQSMAMSTSYIATTARHANSEMTVLSIS